MLVNKISMEAWCGENVMADLNGEDLSRTLKKLSPFCENFMCVSLFLQEDVFKNYFSLCRNSSL